MNVAIEPCIRTLHEVHCYLRLSGLSVESACRRLRDVCVWPADSADRLWPQVLAWAADGAPARLRDLPRPHPPPPIERGHIAYADLGRPRRPPRRGDSAAGATRGGWRKVALRRRLAFAALVALQTLAGVYAILGVLPYHGTTLLELAIVIVFALLFGWISAGFWVAVLGFFIRRRGGDPAGLTARYARAAAAKGRLARTAVVFPIYHEDIRRTLAGLRSIYRDLAATGELAWFEFFVLSDSRDPDVWLAEQEAWYRLCEELEAHGRIHYRRRIVNLKRKSGNIADFLRRWGARYTYMVVMDADSLMTGATLIRMVNMMESAPQVGILQTAPDIVNAVSAHARVQQFANRLYGPLFAAGLAALQLGEAVFWGHNAMIRVRPFMRHCGLKRLPGRGFLQGTVLSHDFVEAACMRHAGYEVWLEPALSGSYEEAPPTLIDEMARDRRWAHGNLQHLYFLGRSGVCLAHRLAFANGIMSYLASLLWFVFLVLTTLEVAQFVLRPIRYFPDPHGLFPVWPEWHPQWAVRLALSTLFVLFTAKLLAYIDVLLDRRRLRAMAGAGRVLLGVVTESAASVLLAPIRMLSHTKFILGTLLNLRVGWAGQNRTHELGWRAAVLSHAPGSLLALAWAGYMYRLQPLFFYWSLPVALPLLLAAPISVWLSRFQFGDLLRRHRLLITPEESDPPRVVRELYAAPPPPASPLTPFEAVIVDPWRNRLQRGLASSHRGPDRQPLVERCLRDGPDALSAADKTVLLRDAGLLQALHESVWSEGRGAYWSRRIERLCGISIE